MGGAAPRPGRLDAGRARAENGRVTTALQRAFGEATALLRRTRRLDAGDLALVAALGGLVYTASHLVVGAALPLRPSVEIDLSLGALPGYALLSLARALAAYVISLAYGYWAARDAAAERVLVPLLDVLQSVPVLGFMPGLILSLVALFPRSNVGLELAAVLMIFTGQAWNMTFSFYRSLRTLPGIQLEVARHHRFDWWQRFKWLELPSAIIGLVWNSMMSMAGGWFFLMVCESFVLGARDFRLPGLGSYMSVAVERGDGRAMAAATLTMAVLIVALDQLLWRPAVVWSQKFRADEGPGEGEAPRSWFLSLLRRSRFARLVRMKLAERRLARPAAPPRAPRPAPGGHPSRLGSLVSVALLLVMLGAGAVGLVHLVAPVPPRAWGVALAAAGATLLRVLCAVALGTAWALPAGIAIGLSPRLSRTLQPVIQVVASFPAPMLFPAVIAVF